ncbi:hormogonium polysaccharide secretion pseudopilin HpsC [Nostoc sp. MG11]|uniref:hormogonium polysaccharide secretion pseudopilin HpsC n=1 Tax=Nostoc sp. MG11 TaxID=2721166 RepID=UPI00186712A8|nr:hormogonium polysaccharide secretion pseudopilin HpsC [Nostoc sp. MG11]
MRTLKFLLRSHLTRSKAVQQVGGFTMIELLIAMILAFLVITPLMGFMINIMNTDRQEQAKANSEQEIQAALDYIARDLQQAIYIYDQTGINALSQTTDNGPQIPNGTDRVPVLVFWKRELASKVIPITSDNNDKNDTFVYSLVAYYLLKDSNTTWSKAARIVRWQIKDGVPATTGGVACPGYSGTYISDDNCPSEGFALFKLDGVGSIEEKMNGWKRLSGYEDASGDDIAVGYANSIVLVDFIDQTKTDDALNPAPPVACSPISLPATATFNTRDTAKMTGFYACIDRVNTTAQVFIRGNALARIENDPNKLKYSDSKRTYFPNASVRVQGRGYLYTK